MKRPSFTCFLLLAAAWAAWSAPAQAGERVYGARLAQSHWSVTSGKTYCRLEQPIPDFGRAVFSQTLGGPLVFELDSYRTRLGRGRAALRAIPPEWRRGAPIAELGTAPVDTAHRRVRVADGRPEQLLAELEDGVDPAVFMPERPAGQDNISVLISAVRFQAGLDKFLSCRARLLGMDLAKLRNRTFYFKSNQTRISPRAKQVLRQMAEFIKAGSAPRTVVVNGFADGSGNAGYNRHLSLRRAQTVRAYLVALGVAGDQIHVHGLGDHDPVVDDHSAGGRSHNRRVEVQVLN